MVSTWQLSMERLTPAHRPAITSISAVPFDSRVAPATSQKIQIRYRVRAQSTSSWRRASRAEAGTLVTAIVSPSALKTSMEYPSVSYGMAAASSPAEGQWVIPEWC